MEIGYSRILIIIIPKIIMKLEQLRELQAIQKVIGDDGEDWVLEFERRRLAGHPLLNKVAIYGRYDIGLGYDIRSFESVGSQQLDRYIEVKSYSGTPHFYLSEGERAAAEKYKGNYYIYLIDITKFNDADYEPIIIRDPVNTLDDDKWKQTTQRTEYTFVGESAKIPDDFFESVVMIGCFNDNKQFAWIQKTHCYNVRARVNGYGINGGVDVNEMTSGVRYMILYNVQAPRQYSVYRIDKSKVVGKGDMIRYGYSNPHSPYYILYNMTEKIELPLIDVMQVLRTNNDKVIRTSGTPVYVLGERLRKYFTEMSMHKGIAAPKRGYSNAGKPWTQAQRLKLEDMLAEGKDIAYIAMKLYRTIEEVEAEIGSEK